MAGNPLIDQGVLNLLKASVVWSDFPGLNVTAPFLDRAGITLRLDGKAALQHGTMTGVVQSPQPYLPVTVVIPLLRTQPLSEAYKTQMEKNVFIGAGTVWPDVAGGAGLSSYQLAQMAIESVGELNFAGQTPQYGVSLMGVYYVNSDLFN